MKIFYRLIFIIFFFNQAQASVETEMHFLSDSFVSEAYEATPKAQYQFLSVHAMTDKKKNDIVVLDLASGYAFGSPLLSYLNVSEFYFNLSNNEDVSEPLFTFGRRNFLWSFVDRDWDLGLWEPVFKSNPLNPSPQGLTGIFMDSQVDFLHMTFFASPLFIPSQGPSFEIENGSFIKGNPWFRRPPESFRFSSEISKIDYQFDRPKESQVVFQTSVGGKFQYSYLENQSVSLSHIYKPMNELGLSYGAILDISQDKGIVSIYPQVVYHTLTSIEVENEISDFRFGLNSTWDRPRNESALWKEGWTRPDFRDAQIYSQYIEWNFFKNHRIGIKNLNIFNGDVVEIGEWGSSKRPAISARFPFRQARGLYLMDRWKIGRNEFLMSQVEYSWSDFNEFDLLRTQVSYTLNKKWKLDSELIFVDAKDVTVQNYNEIAEYRNNDRWMMGATYVF